MKTGKKIGIIDSQDALIGNPAYDLVSLIDDVRIKTKNDLKDKIFNYYIKNSMKIIGKIKVFLSGNLHSLTSFEYLRTAFEISFLIFANFFTNL